MSAPKVHMVRESPWRFNGAPADWLSICPVLQSERINPDTTTRDPEKVTCKRCLAKLAKGGAPWLT